MFLRRKSTKILILMASIFVCLIANDALGQVSKKTAKDLPTKFEFGFENALAAKLVKVYPSHPRLSIDREIHFVGKSSLKIVRTEDVTGNVKLVFPPINVPSEGNTILRFFVRTTDKGAVQVMQRSLATRQKRKSFTYGTDFSSRWKMVSVPLKIKGPSRIVLRFSSVSGPIWVDEFVSEQEG
jgi:hypothetical protein